MQEYKHHCRSHPYGKHKKPKGRGRGAYQQGSFYPIPPPKYIMPPQFYNRGGFHGSNRGRGARRGRGKNTSGNQKFRTSNKHPVYDIPQSSPTLNPGQLLIHSEHTWDTNKPHNQTESTNLPERLKTLSTNLSERSKTEYTHPTRGGKDCAMYS